MAMAGTAIVIITLTKVNSAADLSHLTVIVTIPSPDLVLTSGVYVSPHVINRNLLYLVTEQQQSTNCRLQPMFRYPLVLQNEVKALL